jgi:hypothetical protein
MGKKSYGPIINFYEEILPNLEFTDNDEILFFDQLEIICNLLNNEFGENNVVISGSLAMFLQGIRLREHQDQSDIDIFLLSDTLKDYNEENLNKEKYKYWLYKETDINVKLDVLTQKIFTRNFFSYNTFQFNDVKIKVETPESLLRYETLALKQDLGKEKFNDDIPKIQKWINNKNDNECVSIIKALNDIFSNINIPYVIAGSYSLWMQGIKLERSFGYDVDIILLCEKNSIIVDNLIQNEEFQKILYSYNINKKLDFVDKHPIIDNHFNKINFKGYSVYVTDISNFIKTKLRYLREQKSQNNVIKSKFDLECLSNLDEYKKIIIDYDLIGTINDMNNKIEEVLKINNDNNQFYNNIQNQFNSITQSIINKLKTDTNNKL